MSYAAARHNEYLKEELFRVYVTDALKILTSNTAKYAGGEYLKKTYREAVNPKPEETRSADEIIANIKSKLGGESS